MANSVFSGITTFAKLPWVQCLGKDKDAAFDIAFIGAPFVRSEIIPCNSSAHRYFRIPVHLIAQVHALAPLALELVHAV
jgi:hypothetical protein